MTYKAELGYYPQIILAGRRLNDSMGTYVATELIKAMANRAIQVNGSNVLVMGFAFKENCTDFETHEIDVVSELK